MAIWIYRAHTEPHYKHHWVVYFCGVASLVCGFSFITTSRANQEEKFTLPTTIEIETGTRTSRISTRRLVVEPNIHQRRCSGLGLGFVISDFLFPVASFLVWRPSF
jgi:hypothetical protein